MFNFKNKFASECNETQEFEKLRIFSLCNEVSWSAISDCEVIRFVFDAFHLFVGASYSNAPYTLEAPGGYNDIFFQLLCSNEANKKTLENPSVKVFRQ